MNIFGILCAFATFIMGMGKVFAIEPMAQYSWWFILSPIGLYLILSILIFIAVLIALIVIDKNS